MNKKKIIIDSRMFNESGIGRYIRNLIGQMQILDKENEYFILLLKRDYEKQIFEKNFIKILTDFSWYGVGEQVNLPKVLNKIKPDLVHFPHFNVPVFFKGKFIVTIHDLIHQHFQMRRVTTHDPITYKIKQLGYDVIFKAAIKRSIKIIVPSEYVRNLLVEDWKIDERKIIVTHEAVDEEILSIAKNISEKEIERTMDKFDIKSPYLFYVGNAHPHKNVEGLIDAFLVLKNKYKNLSLVLAGSDHYFWQRLKKENQHKDIIYTGFVTDDELVALYRNSKAFVFPSKEEGFGIPILEAFVSSCPVVSSNAGSLPEVGGNACLYFDPLVRGEMVEKISEVLDDDKLRQQLVEKGLKRYKLFSWQSLAKKTLEVYKQCV